MSERKVDPQDCKAAVGSKDWCILGQDLLIFYFFYLRYAISELFSQVPDHNKLIYLALVFWIKCI